jgi:hypothetical protein
MTRHDTCLFHGRQQSLRIWTAGGKSLLMPAWVVPPLIVYQSRPFYYLYDVHQKHEFRSLVAFFTPGSPLFGLA